MKRLWLRLIGLCVFGLLATPTVIGQGASAQVDSLKQRIKNVEQSAAELSASKRRVLSSGMQNLLQLADSLDRTGKS